MITREDVEGGLRGRRLASGSVLTAACVDSCRGVLVELPVLAPPLVPRQDLWPGACALLAFALAGPFPRFAPRVGLPQPRWLPVPQQQRLGTPDSGVDIC